MASQADNLEETQRLYNEAVTAIRDIMNGGQRVTVGDREFEAAKLADLKAFRDELWAEIQSKRGAMFVRATFGRVS